MAGNYFGTSSGEVTCSTTPTTILQIRAAANVGRHVRKIVVEGREAAGGTESPGTVELLTSGSTGTGSAVTEGTPASGETLQGSSKHTFTVEPTTPVATGQKRSVYPSGGVGVFLFDPPLRIPGGQAINVRVTAASATPKFQATADAEE